ncbi:hypothetical protein BS78_01G259300 [Paspalum vaginatum]|nr:hypothetical protein BS78_01G259300 [Paspalum vaginatum]
MIIQQALRAMLLWTSGWTASRYSPSPSTSGTPGPQPPLCQQDAEKHRQDGGRRREADGERQRGHRAPPRWVPVRQHDDQGDPQPPGVREVVHVALHSGHLRERDEVVQYGVEPEPGGLPHPERHAQAGAEARHQGASAQRVLGRPELADPVGDAHEPEPAQDGDAEAAQVRRVALRRQGDPLGRGQRKNLHFNFFVSKFGASASAQIYQQVGQIDHTAVLFINEFNVLEQPYDPNAVPSKYVAKMNEIRSYPGNGGLKLGVGLESHFSTPNMRGALDTLAKLKLPMWLTEVDVVKGPSQVKFLEKMLREGYAHPNVDGMIMWAAWHANGNGCYVMCLTDNSFKNLPVGNVVDKLIAEWKTHRTATVRHR